MANGKDKITYFAETDSRNKRVPFGIKEEDRSRHVYVIGKTGMGKSTLLENMAVQDIKNGEGLAFIDPHGKTAELLLDYIPQERINDVIYFAPFDLDFPISFNVMEDVGYERRHLVANGLMSAFKKIWVDAWSARMEYILNNVLLALLEYPDSTLIGVNRMLVDKEYRRKVVENITDPSVKSFWLDEFAKYGERYMQEAGAAIQNKIGQFISNPVVRNIIGQPRSTFDLRKVMDEKKILIINLSKGRVGEANANLLGSMIITKIYLAALSRADVSPSVMKTLPNYYLYVDEFQSFANESFADILSEARKYKLSLTIAHQYIEQMSEEVRAAVFGNVGTMITFRVGAFDAEVLEKEYAPVFTQEDLVNLGFVQVYLKLMIDGVTSHPFSATTLPPIEKPLVSFKESIIETSRASFTRPRSEVEEEIRKWHEPIRLEPRKRDELGTGNPHAAGGMSVPRNDVPKDSPMPRREDKNQSRESKEIELRKAIAQNYPKRPEPKSQDSEKKKENKKDKGPTTENVSALRAALSAVLKETEPTPFPQPQVPEPKPQPIPEASKIEKKPEEPKPEPIRHEPKAESRKKAKEVPEDILRKVLEIE
jgi:energy-coupling factor transporter ATP-binding protein EcfA2